MRTLSNADLLALWENGRRLHSLDRGLLAVRASLSEPAEENAADWPLGRRNAVLAQLHQACLSPRLQGLTECAHCGEKLEFALDCATLVERQRARSPEPVAAKGSSFRLPTSRDLAAVAAECDPGAASLRLLEACRISDSSQSSEQSGEPAEWTQDELEELGKKMIAADPLAEIMLGFDCPVCHASREQTLDLPEFLWAGLESLAKRLLHEVHILACAYGWSESEILSLSESRRALYLEMVRA
jgi:hypothetical protein